MKQTPLNKVGKRAKKFSGGDKKMAALAKLGPCEHCGSTENVEGHHIISRRDSVVRHEPLNVVRLCNPPDPSSCHRWAHDHPAEFRAWLNEKWCGRFDTLQTLSREGSKSHIAYRKEA